MGIPKRQVSGVRRGSSSSNSGSFVLFFALESRIYEKECSFK